MKPPRAFGPLPRVRYRPEVTHCLHCGAALQYSHSVWAKPIQFLTEHIAVQKQECGLGLVLRRGGDIAPHRQITQELFDLNASHIARMPLVEMENEAPRPVDRANALRGSSLATGLEGAAALSRRRPGRP